MSAPPNLNPAPVSLVNQDVDSNHVAQGTVLTRTLHVNITGTLANLAMAGPSGGTWRLLDGKQLGVFGVGNEVDVQIATNQLRTALIHEVNVLQEMSTFPVPLGITLNCLPAREMTDLGERFAYTVLPRMVNSSVQNIYRCDVGTEEGVQASLPRARPAARV